MEAITPRQPFFKLENPCMAYPWGSMDGIATCLGASVPAGLPCAELWMGAHPSAPSLALLDGKTPPDRKAPLDALIARDPEGMLGPRVAAGFGSLPFLFKGLSASGPLSIQAHPSAAFAEEGFARENALGLPLDAPGRTYRDRRHKPELAVALSPFTALCGFRPASEVAELLGPRLQEALGFDPASGEKGLVRLVGRILESGRLPSGLAALLSGRAAELSAGKGRRQEAGALVLRLFSLYPGDPGLFMPLLLDLFTLAPGEGVYIPAGVLHAYIEGTCLEIMANSDNVIRGGLTGKHVDAPELMRVMEDRIRAAREDGRAESPAGAGAGALRANPRRTAEGRVWDTPAAEFSLSSFELPPGGSVRIGVEGPEILLCTGGGVKLDSMGSRLSLARGESAFVAASCGSCLISGPGTVWRAAVPPEAATGQRPPLPGARE